MNIIDKINNLKKERKAVILVHNYQPKEIQDIADYKGDSLKLSVEASRTKADVIIVCGVYFMAETAKVLSPDRKVLIPNKNAGCPMADMISIEQLQAMKKEHPKAKTLCYVNSSAEVKAESDVCCTSANATAVVKKFFNDDDEIIFVPDKHLAKYTALHVKQTIIPWHGYCPTHIRILPEFVNNQKKLHPEAEVLVHPECYPAVTVIADHVLSTAGMSKHVKRSKAKEFIIGTEIGMLHCLKEDNPDKVFFAASDLAVCPNMKRITLANVLDSLKDSQHEISLSDEIIKRARKSIQRMIECIE